MRAFASSNFVYTLFSIWSDRHYSECMGFELSSPGIALE